MTVERPELSLLIPVYNGARTIGALVERLAAELNSLRIEFVLVNDGSSDDSDAVCRNLHEAYPNQLTYVKLARNFGEHNAVMAGLAQTTGAYVVIMDDDFQNPPEEVLKLHRAARDGSFDVIYSQYERKQHSLFRNLGSTLHNRMAVALIKKPKDLYLSSFKCLSRWLVEQVVEYAGPFPYLDGLIFRCTRNYGTVEVRHDERIVGRSGYTLHKLIRLWLNMFLNFSILPLRAISVLGFGVCLGGLVLGGIAIVERLANPDLVPGWAALTVATTVFSGVQLLMLGMLGEYLGSMFLSHNQTPQYVIRETLSRND